MKIKEMFTHLVEFEYWDDYTCEWISERFNVITEKETLQEYEAESILAKGTSVTLTIKSIQREYAALVVLEIE